MREGNPSGSSEVMNHRDFMPSPVPIGVPKTTGRALDFPSSKESGGTTTSKGMSGPWLQPGPEHGSGSSGRGQAGISGNDWAVRSTSAVMRKCR